jgi:uncharacterized protein (TIGR02453 family)
VPFTGFPERLIDFYEGLEADNSKAYWTDHKAVYDADVAAPMRALLEELEPEFGAAKLFRPYRDVRFSKDKTPYKTQVAAVVHEDTTDAGVLYIALGAEGLFVAGGYYQTATDQAQRLRAAAADDTTGPALARILATLREAGWDVGGDRLKRVPKPWDADHPRADLLTHKSLVASRSAPPEPWLHTAQARERIAGWWRELAPLNAWLGEHVGASTAPARGR